MAIPVNLLRTLCVIRKHKALFDRVFPATVAGKTRVHIPQTPEKTSVDGITRTFSSLLQGYAISGNRWKTGNPPQDVRILSTPCTIFRFSH